MPTSYTITLGKDVTVTGVSHARSVTVSSSATEIDTTVLGASARSFSKGLIEQKIDVECVDAPGCASGDTITIAGTHTGDASYIVTSIAQAEPIDGIVTYTVSASRTTSS
jgi:hypothetical protein